MTDRTLWEHQRALHLHAEKVLERAFNNEELMAQVRDGIEQIKRGERGVPLREIREQERQRAEGA